MKSDRTRSPLATRRRHPPAWSREAVPGDRKATQAHREREQAQGTLGTADHSTRALETGQSRVPMCSATVPRPPTGAGDTGINDAAAGSLPGPRTAPGRPGSAPTVPRRALARVLGARASPAGCPIACVAAPTVVPRHPGGHVRIGIQASYSGGFQETAAEIRDLESAGLDVAAVAEVYTFDAVSQLGYLAAVTERVELLSAIFPIYSRTPALTAMTAAGLDFVSGGRFTLGLGASGPQVIEGWHGVPYDAPLQRTREIVEICRQVWRRERLDHAGQEVHRSRCRPTRAPAWASR